MNQENKQYQLEDLLAQAPQAPTDLIMTQKEAQKATADALPALSQADQEKIAAIKADLDLRQSDLANYYGVQAEKDMATFSDSILSQVQARDAGELGKLLTDLLVKVENSDTSEDLPWFSRLFVSGKNKLAHFLTSYQSLSQEIDGIAAHLQDQQEALKKNVVLFDALYKQNLSQYKELGLYIQAGTEKIQEMREEALPALYEQAKASDNPMALQVVKDLEANVVRFERKVHELRISQTLALQTAPQIKLIQNNDQLMIDKVNDVLTHTLPLWRSQTVIALGLARQEEALAMHQKISATTNQLIKDNARKLKETALGVQEEAQRASVDIETLEAANRDLIETIKGSLAISQKAEGQRQAAQEKMTAIKEDLRSALQEGLSQ